MSRPAQPLTLDDLARPVLLEEEPDSGGELALVLSSMTEILRCQRETLERLRRVEDGITELRARFETIVSSTRNRTGVRAPRTEEAARSDRPLSDDTLLRGIETVVRGGAQRSD
ncbi:MAG: hypothetical protein H6983_12190 [Ectothiorhodospiraceae bacterium]|nr:hypothetical protein [Chromatiales bacterium]MCP5154920.1 hypothetical protein [Ectothiorhodospiraceae bacterium]